MIRIKKEKYVLRKGDYELLNKNVVENTCKTNINPQLMFKQSYTGVTGKTFVGNWHKNGFWISKYRRQLLELRPDIISKFVFRGENKENLIVVHSIGFSSIFSSAFIGVFFIVFLKNFVDIPKIYGLAIWIFLYVLICSFALNKMRKSIKEKIMLKV
jgi:hypothetical protein